MRSAGSLTLMILAVVTDAYYQGLAVVDVDAVRAAHLRGRLFKDLIIHVEYLTAARALSVRMIVT